jgi:hypothetical protein
MVHVGADPHHVSAGGQCLLRLFAACEHRHPRRLTHPVW